MRKQRTRTTPSSVNCRVALTARGVAGMWGWKKRWARRADLLLEGARGLSTLDEEGVKARQDSGEKGSAARGRRLGERTRRR